MLWIRENTNNLGDERQFRNALRITLFGNLVLAIGKGVVAWLSGSSGIYADTANSVSDVIYSLMMVLGLWLSRRPADISHPQGHSRFEPLVGVGIMASMFYAAFEAARASITRFIEGGVAIEPGLPTVALAISVLLKVWMFYSIRRCARDLHNPTLATAAKDNLSDVLTTSAAFVGVIGSRLLSPITDPIAGILVSLWIFRNAFNAGKENLGYLTGQGASQEIREKIVATAASVPGVLGVHQTITEYVGTRLIADLHIDVDASLSVEQAHTIVDEVTNRTESLTEVDRAYVHAEPIAMTDT